MSLHMSSEHKENQFYITNTKFLTVDNICIVPKHHKKLQLNTVITQNDDKKLQSLVITSLDDLDKSISNLISNKLGQYKKTCRSDKYEIIKNALEKWKIRIIYFHKLYLLKNNLSKIEAKKQKMSKMELDDEKHNNDVDSIKISNLNQKQKELQANIAKQRNILIENFDILCKQRESFGKNKELTKVLQTKYNKYCNLITNKKVEGNDNDEILNKLSDYDKKLASVRFGYGNNNDANYNKIVNKTQNINKLLLNLKTGTNNKYDTGSFSPITNNWTPIKKIAIEHTL